MDKVESSLEVALDRLVALENAIGGSSIDPSSSLAAKTNAFVNALAGINAAGGSMEAAIPVPLELLAFLDAADNASPESFRAKLLEDCRIRAASVTTRVEYAEVRLYFL